MDPISTTADPLDPQEAIDYFRKKSKLTDEQFKSLAEQNHSKAFTLAGVADIDTIQDVYDALDTALAEGTLFKDFKESVAESLESAWGGTVKNPGFRIANIFRTNLQSSYAAGRYEQAKEGKEDRPYLMLDTVDDQDRCPDCEAIAEAIGNQAIPFDEWDDELPPYHNQCRDSIITLSESEAIEQGILESMPDLDEHIDDGFMGPPDSYEPDSSEYDDDLVGDIDRFVGSDN